MPHSSLTISQMDVQYSIIKRISDDILDGYSQMDIRYSNVKHPSDQLPAGYWILNIKHPCGNLTDA